LGLNFMTQIKPFKKSNDLKCKNGRTG